MIVAVLLGLSVNSCRREPKPEPTPPVDETPTLAVVYPHSLDARLKRTAQWFMETHSLDFKLEWFEEETANMSTLGSTLAAREDILAVIGPFDNERLAVFANECQATQKPLIAPVCGSEEVLRRYCVKTAGADKNIDPFLWSLSATDIPFTELLLSHYGAYQEENKEYTRFAWPAFFCPDDAYGKTFYDWAPFFSHQQDFRIKQYDVFSDTGELIRLVLDQMDYIYDSGFWQYLSGFCVLETPEQLLKLARERRRWMLSNEQLQQMYEFPSTNPDDPATDEFQPLFLDYYRCWVSLPDVTDEAFQALGDGLHLIEGCQGISPYADPSTGFADKYKAHFGVYPSFAECKFCDALLLADKAVRNEAAETHWPENLNINRRINYSIFLATPIQGVSGEISYDGDTCMPTCSSTYLMWEIKDGKLEHLHYYCNGASEVMEDWRESYDERYASDDFDAQGGDRVDGEYAPLTQCYAVLVQASDQFHNYRHGADVLRLYQYLRNSGMDDDHIILIMDKALATYPENPEPGVIRAAMLQPDLYGGTDGLPAAVVDYDAANLEAADIAAILMGASGGRLGTVLPQDDGNNVLFYWSGHGRKASATHEAEFAWRSSPEGSGFSASILSETISAMRFRKLLVIAEPCYGEAVLEPMRDLSHCLGFSGAAADEQSWADCWNPQASFWMCDRFSQNLVDCLEETPDATYRDVFLYCALNTLGSHPRIVPGWQFGNIYINSPKEFFVK